MKTSYETASNVEWRNEGIDLNNLQSSTVRNVTSEAKKIVKHT